MGNDRNADGLVRTGLHARGSFTRGKSLAAHVAFADDASGVGILRHIVGAHQDAILATDALVIEVEDNSGQLILFIREHRTAIEACRVDAMVARRGNELLKRPPPIVAYEHSHVAPCFVIIEPVQRMARRDTGLAATAFIKLNFKRELLPGRRDRQGDEITIPLAGQAVVIVGFREYFDCGKFPLLGKQLVDQGPGLLPCPR